MFFCVPMFFFNTSQEQTKKMLKNISYLMLHINIFKLFLSPLTLTKHKLKFNLTLNRT
jgi:hypothetical protein